MCLARSSFNITDAELREACKRGDLELVKKDIQQNLKRYIEPFHAACSNGHLEIVKELIAQRVDIEKPGFLGRTPFFLACRYGHKDIVQELIAQHVDIEKPDNEGWTPLHEACAQGHVEIVRELITQHVDIEKPENRGWTPFYVACDFGRIQIVRDLSSIVKMAEIKENLCKHDNEIQSILLERIQKEYHIPVIHLLFGQQQPGSPLSVLHRDVLQDISKTIKEKIFL